MEWATLPVVVTGVSTVVGAISIVINFCQSSIQRIRANELKSDYSQFREIYWASKLSNPNVLDSSELAARLASCFLLADARVQVLKPYDPNPEPRVHVWLSNRWEAGKKILGKSGFRDRPAREELGGPGCATLSCNPMEGKGRFQEDSGSAH